MDSDTKSSKIPRLQPPTPPNQQFYFSRMWGLLSSSEKKKSPWVFLGILTSGVADILGLGAVMPLIALVVDPTLT